MVGKTLGHYEILEPLGKGGMGEVYRARDTNLDRDVAVKVLPEDFAEDTERLARFEREAKLLASLNHPHIAAIYGLEDAEGTRFIAMELVEGQTLEDRLTKGPMSVKKALESCRQIAEALEAAHEEGIIHRDLKPANVVVSSSKRVKVLDFGIAKAPAFEEGASETEKATALTTGGMVLGTAPYMSPEQVRGASIDKRADIWAFGCVMYEVLTGKQAFHRETVADTLAAVIEVEPDWTRLPSSTPQLVASLLRRCLRKDPDRRLHDIADARIEIEEALSEPTGGLVSAEPAVSEPVLWRRALSWGLAAVAVTVALAGAAAYVLVNLRSGPPSEVWTIEPVTMFEGPEWQPTWSPDGARIAYIHPAAGSFDIYTMPIGGGDPLRVTDHPAGEFLPRWSPDGRHLVFLSDRGAGTNLFLVPATGGVERKVAETHLEGDMVRGDLGAVPWSPEGEEIIFSRLQPGDEIALWKISLATGEETQVTSPPPGAHDLKASWSFDGEWLVFERQHEGRRRLWLLPAQGREPRLLLDDEYISWAPAWSADSRRVLFNTNREGARGYWEVEIDSGRERQLLGHTLFFPVVSPTGPIAYSTFRHQTDLYQLQVDSGTDRRLTTHTGDNFGPRVSPDGQRVLYCSRRTGNNYEIWLLDQESGDEIQLTQHPGRDVLPDWSPEGDEIAFLSNREGRYQLWVMNADGGDLRRLTDDAVWLPSPGTNIPQNLEGSPRWSPDGKSIGYLVSGPEGVALWTVDREGKPARRVLSGALAFDWYRDGRHVIYIRRSKEGNSRELVAADLETGKEALLLRGAISELVVARDGSALTYADPTSHISQDLYLQRLTAPDSSNGLPRALGEPEPITDGGGVWHSHNGGWSPDGAFVVYTRDADSGDLYVVGDYR